MTVLEKLDNWVNWLDVGIPYTIPDIKYPLKDKLQVYPVFGCQQVRNELSVLVDTILSQPWIKQNPIALEIGLGHHGSSHFLWRELFSKIITIEKNHDRVNNFAKNMQRYYNNYVLGDGKSNFVIGMSQDPSSVNKVYNSVQNIDFLFIDGDHHYENALTDWLLYSPLVKTGGMVVFHDSRADYGNGGAERLVNELRNGRFGKHYQITDIVHSLNVGTSYYIV